MPDSSFEQGHQPLRVDGTARTVKDPRSRGAVATAQGLAAGRDFLMRELVGKANRHAPIK